MKFRTALLLFFALWWGRQVGWAQDLRLTQYWAQPLLLNPALSGSDTGAWRLNITGARVAEGSLSNQFLALGFDKPLFRNRWGFGLHYLKSGAKDFLLGLNAFNISLAHRWQLDAAGRHQLRLGIQGGVLHGKAYPVDRSYSPWLDSRSFYYNSTEGARLGKLNASYFNVNAGIWYRLAEGPFLFETGMSFHNVLHPLSPNRELNELHYAKRVRAAAQLSLAYQLNRHTAIQFKQLAWKEGLYYVGFNAQLDSLRIQENLYELNLQRHRFKLGVMSRSWRTVAFTVQQPLGKQVLVALSYEQPITQKKYYQVSQLSASVLVQPQKKAAHNTQGSQGR